MPCGSSGLPLCDAMTGGALIVMEVIDAEKKAEEESSAPRSFRTWYESVFSWIAAFAYKGGGRPGKYQLALTMNT